MPTAMIAMIADCRTMLSRLLVVRKPLSPRVAAKAMNTRTKPM
jgi:hypothetical protein